MPPRDPLARFPASFRQSNEPEAPLYEQVPSLAAVLGRGPLPAAGRVHLVRSFTTGDVHICRREVAREPRLLPDAVLSAVYRLGGAGADAVPTGRLFVRFVEGICVEDRTADLAAAGFWVDHVPGHAPHAAYLRPTSGNAADALTGAAVLATVRDLVRVEPEVLSERQAR